MVNATVDNEAVSISLSVGESTTVPSGEVWRVTITIGEHGTYQEETTYLEINNDPVMSLKIDDSSSYAQSSPSIQTVVTGGDTISLHTNTEDTSGYDNGAHIGGFVVN